MQDHGIPEQTEVNKYLRIYAKKYNIKLVATNDVHYVDKEDAKSQDVLLCVQTAADYNDPNRMRFPCDEFYLKTEEEMSALFADTPEAITNTINRGQSAISGSYTGIICSRTTTPIRAKSRRFTSAN